MSTAGNHPPNCVGFAYNFIGLKPDGFYDPDEVLIKFRQVPADQAEIVAAVFLGPDGSPSSVRHVTPYPPDEYGFVMHRPYTGAEPESRPYEDAIGYMRVLDGLIFLRRKES